MPNWSIKATAAAINATNPANLDVTFTATNSGTSEVVTEVAPGSTWTTNKAKAYAEGMVERLNTRDTLRASAAAALSPVQAFIATNTVLATG